MEQNHEANHDTVPSKEKDILTLQKSYQEAGYHKFLNGRKIPRAKDKAKDYTTRGYTHLHTGRVIERWQGLRTFERSKAERWGNEHGSDSDSESEWSDSEEGGEDDDLRTAEFLKLVEARLGSETDWYHPDLILEDEDGGVAVAVGEEAEKEAHSDV